jgi:hypothetical protein
VFDRPKFADAVIVTTQDRMHYEPFCWRSRLLPAGRSATTSSSLRRPRAASWACATCCAIALSTCRSRL